MDKALTALEILDLLDHKCTIMPYSHLSTFESLDDIFNPFPVVFLLYETKKNVGHWVVLCKYKKVCNFFDSYGMFPDDELDYSMYNSNDPILLKLMVDSPLEIKYNPYPLQEINNSKMATCGRWCCLYAYLYKKVSFKQFADMFKGVDEDYVVTLITSFI